MRSQSSTARHTVVNSCGRNSSRPHITPRISGRKSMMTDRRACIRNAVRTAKTTAVLMSRHRSTINPTVPE
jgi:hypothetical protein